MNATNFSLSQPENQKVSEKRTVTIQFWGKIFNCGVNIGGKTKQNENNS